MARIQAYIFLSLVWLLGCDSLDRKERLDAYYDLELLIEEQLTYLQHSSPQLRKIATLDGSNDTTVIAGEEVDWEKELDVFVKSNINRPAMVGSFETDETVRGKLTYQRTDPDASGVSKLIIDYFPNTRIPEIISVHSSTGNMLYESENRLRIAFDYQNGQQVLRSYYIKGTQSILGAEPTVYVLRGEVISH